MESTMQMLERRDAFVHDFWTRAARETCVIKNGRRQCHRESFFHRVGRWILTGILVFFGLIALMILCCCIRRRRSKKAKEAAAGYNAQYATPHAPLPPVQYAPPPSHPVNQMGPQVTGTTEQGAAASYYGSGR